MNFRSILSALTWLFAILGIIALCLFFPRFLRVVEALMRELRYVWWVVLLLGVGLYLRYGLGRSNR